MKLTHLASRLRGRYQSLAATALFRRTAPMRNTVPLISFTFDDFPRSALLVGGEILRRHNVAGTYYASLGLMGKQAATGALFEKADLERALEQGHELGCHTFDHLHSWDTQPAVFEKSVMENQRMLQKILPGACFRSLSYPILVPRPATKRRVGRHFDCCRCGGQTFNAKRMDSNHLSAFFLEKVRNDIVAVRRVIEQNRAARGWLIFATHDVSDDPTPYGCEPRFFEEVVRCSVSSGARVLPVVKAWETLSCARS